MLQLVQNSSAETEENMRQKQKLKDLTIKNNFMFGAVMMDAENCRDFLEMTLGFEIEKVDVSKEKSIVYHPEYRGVRLDVYAKDTNNTRYNVEMQVVQKPALGKRARYYHGQLDMELLATGADYTELPDTYIIFICDFDPFGMGKYCYTFERRCKEDSRVELGEGSRSIFLSTYGKNEHEVPKALVKFLKFVKADLKESLEDFEDDFVKRLQRSIQSIKSNREMEEKFMILREMLRDERAEGKAEGMSQSLLVLLGNLGSVPEELKKVIVGEKDLSKLEQWFQTACESDSIQKFLEKM